MTGRRLALFCLLTFGMTLSLLPAHAVERDGPRDVPSAELRVGDQRQRQGSWSTQWFSCDENGDGSGFAGDGFPSPPDRALAVDPGRIRGRIILSKDEQPSRVKLATRTELDGNGYPTGPNNLIDSSLRPQRRPNGDVVGWVVRFRSRIRDHLYPELDAVWKGDCTEGTGDTSYVFHLETRG